MKIILVSITLLLTIAPLAIPIPAAKRKYCQPNEKFEDTYCRCLAYHPEKEFCKDENAPLPSCCRAAGDEPDSKTFNGCACCNAKLGTSVINSVQKGGRYIHDNPDFNPIVEYRLK